MYMKLYRQSKQDAIDFRKNGKENDAKSSDARAQGYWEKAEIYKPK